VLKHGLVKLILSLISVIFNKINQLFDNLQNKVTFTEI